LKSILTMLIEINSFYRHTRSEVITMVEDVYERVKKASDPDTPVEMLEI